jgi:hypothetical protein
MDPVSGAFRSRSFEDNRVTKLELENEEKKWRAAAALQKTILDLPSSILDSAAGWGRKNYANSACFRVDALHQRNILLSR